MKKLSKTKKELAQTMVEFALVFPVLLLIIYGLIEFGRMVFIYAAVTGSAREGARYGAATGDFQSKYYMDCSGIVKAAQRGAIMTSINNISIWYDRGPSTFVVSSTCPPLDSYGIDKIKQGDRIVVRVTARYTPMIAILRFSGFDITAENARTILFDVEVGGASLPSAKQAFTKAANERYQIDTEKSTNRSRETLSLNFSPQRD